MLYGIKLLNLYLSNYTRSKMICWASHKHQISKSIERSDLSGFREDAASSRKVPDGPISGHPWSPHSSQCMHACPRPCMHIHVHARCGVKNRWMLSLILPCPISAVRCFKGPFPPSSFFSRSVRDFLYYRHQFVPLSAKDLRGQYQ